MFQSTWYGSAQDVEAGVLVEGEGVDGLGHRAASGFGIVVFGTEMAEPHAARFGGEMLLQASAVRRLSMCPRPPEMRLRR